MLGGVLEALDEGGYLLDVSLGKAGGGSRIHIQAWNMGEQERCRGCMEVGVGEERTEPWDRSTGRGLLCQPLHCELETLGRPLLATTSELGWTMVIHRTATVESAICSPPSPLVD